MRYERELKADRFLLIASGTPDDVERARGLVRPFTETIDAHP